MRSPVGEMSKRRPRVLRHFLSRIVRNLSFKRYSYLTADKRSTGTQLLLSELEECLRSSMEQKLTEKRHELAIWIQRFEGLSPLRKLNGGYAFVSDSDGHAVTEISQIKKGDRISIAVTDGVIEAVADRIRKEER